jgi:hypothetical protein
MLPRQRSAYKPSMTNDGVEAHPLSKKTSKDHDS